MASLSHLVALREITADTVRAITDLKVADYQNRFVAPNAVSLAQALFGRTAWYRAIYLGDEPVGFVLLADDSQICPLPVNPEIVVWRFMVDARYQRQGIGRAAMKLIIEHARAKGVFDRLQLSYVPDEGSAQRLYESLGFKPTGKVVDGEVEMELQFDSGAA